MPVAPTQKAKDAVVPELLCQRVLLISLSIDVVVADLSADENVDGRRFMKTSKVDVSREVTVLEGTTVSELTC